MPEAGITSGNQHLNLPPGKSGRANIEAAAWSGTLR